jgi:GT2 family glycosyltransferase
MSKVQALDDDSSVPAKDAKPADSPPRVSAVVLNYNGRALLEVVLPSLFAQCFSDMEVVVVDDYSTDDSLAYVREHWPDIRVLSAGSGNVGVAAALNAGVGVARGELVALLNNDLELESNWLGELVAALDRHPDAGSVGGKLLNYYRRDVIDSVGDVFTRAGTAYPRGGGEVDCGQYDEEVEIFAPTAGAALYRACALADVGPFDESFFAYFEDVDWGLRAQLAGYRSWYAPTAVAYHMGSATTGGDTDPRFYALKRRNTIALLVKDVPVSFMARNVHRIGAHQLLSLGYSIRPGMLAVHLKALGAALRAAPDWLRARKQILGGRAIRLREFDRFVSG